MGSYATYGSAGTSAIVIKNGAPEAPSGDVHAHIPGADGVIDPTVGADFIETTSEFIRVIEGHVFIGDLSATDLGSMMVIALTITGTIMKIFYDYVDWRERRLARAEEKENSHDTEVSP